MLCGRRELSTKPALVIVKHLWLQPLSSPVSKYQSTRLGAVSDNAAYINNNSPQNNMLSILFYNARSTLPKLDELAAVCCACNPDIVCIVESWPCGEIANNEISLPNFSNVRLDRNRHGGGILMYIKDDIPFSIVSCWFRDYFCIYFVG